MFRNLMIDFKKTNIAGCFELQPTLIRDSRGGFIKTFHNDIFSELCLETSFKEEYYSISKFGVIRGMHFQLPPHAHTKIVYCISGKVLDVLLDLRKGSPSYKKTISVELSATSFNGIYIPVGVAHGFLSLSDNTILAYKVSTVYNPNFDSGILWNSFGFNWPNLDLIISTRDKNLVNLSSFESPFQFT